MEFFGKLESPPGVEEIEDANGRMGFFVVMLPVCAAFSQRNGKNPVTGMDLIFLLDRHQFHTHLVMAASIAALIL